MLTPGHTRYVGSLKKKPDTALKIPHSEKKPISFKILNTFETAQIFYELESSGTAQIILRPSGRLKVNQKLETETLFMVDK